MLTVNFSPFPILETERLILRRPTKDDVHGIFKLRSNPKTMRYIPRPLAQSEEDSLAHFSLIDAKIENNEGINWTMTLKGDDTFIGLIGIFRIEFENYRAEIGYMILPEFEGQGLMSEAVKEMVRYGFETLQLHSIEGVIDPKHKASEKVLQKTGFVKEAHLVENSCFEGEFWDAVIYSLLKRNFKP